MSDRFGLIWHRADWKLPATSLEKTGWKVTGWWPLPKEDP